MSDAPEAERSKEIAREEARLADLERQAEQARRRLDVLRSQRQLASSTPDVQHVEASSLTPAEKVALFRQLFRGRADVFPKLWVNAKSAKKGYAPACSNKWVRGVCEQAAR